MQIWTSKILFYVLSGAKQSEPSMCEQLISCNFQHLYSSVLGMCCLFQGQSDYLANPVRVLYHFE